jgi:hypothetical protein
LKEKVVNTCKRGRIKSNHFPEKKISSGYSTWPGAANSEKIKSQEKR